MANATLSEVMYYWTYEKLSTTFANIAMAYWAKARVLSIPEMGSTFGLKSRSDIIIVYDALTDLPSIITERVFREKCGTRDWSRLKRYLKYKYSHTKQDFGFNLRIVFNRGYIDIIHYKEEWWQWAIKNAASS